MERVVDVDIQHVAPGSHKFKGATRVGDLVVCAPGSSRGLLVYNTRTQTPRLRRIEIHGDNKFHGATTIGHLALFAPFHSDHLVIFDTESGGVHYEDVRQHWGVRGGGKFNGATTVGNLALFAPFNSKCLLVYDATRGCARPVSIENWAMTGDEPTAGLRFNGVTTVGNLAVFAPFNSDRLVAYDPVTGKTRFEDVTGVAKGPRKFHGAATVGECAVLAPCDADQLLIYNARTREIRGVDITHVARGPDKFNGATAVGDTVYFAPHNSRRILFYNTTTNFVGSVALPRDTPGGAFHGAVALDGRVLFVPNHADRLQVYRAWQPRAAPKMAGQVRVANRFAVLSGGRDAEEEGDMEEI